MFIEGKKSDSKNLKMVLPPVQHMNHFSNDNGPIFLN